MIYWSTALVQWWPQEGLHSCLIILPTLCPVHTSSPLLTFLCGFSLWRFKEICCRVVYHGLTCLFIVSAKCVYIGGYMEKIHNKKGLFWNNVFGKLIRAQSSVYAVQFLKCRLIQTHTVRINRVRCTALSVCAHWGNKRGTFAVATAWPTWHLASLFSLHMTCCVTTAFSDSLFAISGRRCE